MNKHVELNPMQLMAYLAPQKQKYIEGGRGSGKTTLLGLDTQELVRQMPRASFAFVGNTYSQILSRILPALKEGLELFGLYENHDYVVGSMAGKKMGFKLPFQTPDAFNNIMHFSNGCIYQFVSLDHSDSGRGLNSYAVRGDEMALADDEKLAINVLNTNRAQKAIFKKAPLLNSELFTSSTPLTKKGKWFTDKEVEAIKNPKDILFLKATAKQNLHNLRPDYFEYMRQAYTSDVIYNAEMLNIRPKEITNGFYARLNPDVHYYTDYNNAMLEGLDLKEPIRFDCSQDLDLNHELPLIMSVDWGAAINSLVVCQNQRDAFKYLKSMWVKTPKILDNLFLEEFIPYYRPMKNKVVHLYYDRVGNSSVANSKYTYAQQAAKILRDNGWEVHEMTMGANPNHMDKYRLINVALKEDGRGNLPKIRINSANCADLIVSLEHAEVRDTSRGWEKDKRSETRKAVEQQHATHLSDAFDYPFFTLFFERFIGRSLSAQDMPIGTFSKS